MANILHDEGAQYLLQTAFSEEQTVPANFYIMLHNTSPSQTSTIADLDDTEPTGTGYARQAVPSNNTGFAIALDSSDYMATLQSVTFSAGGTWSTVSYATLVTVVSGTSGKAICSWALAAPKTLTNGDTLAFVGKLKVKD